MMDEAKLLKIIEDLREELHEVRQIATLAQQDASREAGPHRRIFIAKDNGDGTFTEWTIAGNALTTFIDGRGGDLMDQEDAIGLIEIEDIDGGNPIYRYLPIGGGGFLKVRLSHTGGGAYSVYAWSDIGLATPIATAKTPGYRPFGTVLEFSSYADRGIGWYEASTFYLVLAIGEQYDIGPCKPDPLP